MDQPKFSPDTEGAGGSTAPSPSLQASDIQRDARTGVPRKVRCEVPLPTADAGTDAVRAFLSRNAQQLELSADEKSLRMIQDVTTPVRRVVRYQQCHEGIPIVDRAVVVQVDTAGRVKQMDLSHEPTSMMEHIAAPAADGVATLSPEAALQAALRHLDTPALRMEPGEPQRVYYPTGEQLRLAYQALIPTREPAHDWRVIVDAYSSEILERRDLLLRVDGAGLVFDPNPVVTANDNTFRDPLASAGSCGFGGTPLATIDGQRVTRTLRDITLAGGIHKLEGPFVRIVNFDAPAHLPPTEASATAFNYSSADPRFEAVNVYYHIDTVQRYIQSLGITTAHNSPIPADAHDNSNGGGAFFSPLDGGLHFGDSGLCNPDRGEDGDVALHEYGHAIQNYQVPGWGVRSAVTGREETRAMGEGFGDILACIFFAERAGGFQREVFEDWIFGDMGGLRRVDGTKVYPTDWRNRVHDDGEIWSAALWNIYRSIGGDSADPQERLAAGDALLKTVILSHHLLAPDASMPDGAEAVMNTNAELPDFLGRHLPEILDIFHERGLLRSALGVDLFLRNHVSDAGADLFTGPVFTDSPDVWNRRSDDGGTAHQSPRANQDNWFYARVQNRGTAPARAFVVSFVVRPSAGAGAVFPDDFIPYISAVAGYDLAPGNAVIVKAKWPAALVPSAGTQLACLVRIHHPDDAPGSGSRVFEHNNLAQKDITVA